MSRDEREEREAYRQEAGREWCHHLPRACPPGAPEWLRMHDYLVGRGLEWDLALANNWYPSVVAGDGELRIVIPGSSMIAGNLFWQARAVDPLAAKRYQSPHAPRGDSVVVVWPKSQIIRRSAIVEGPMDAMAAAGEGLLGIALMGITPPDDALRLTSRFARGTIALVVADNDALGPMAMVMVKLVNHGLAAHLSTAAPYKDLADAPWSARRVILGLDP